MKKIILFTSFLLSAIAGFTQTQPKNWGDVNLSLGGIGFFWDNKSAAPGGIISSIGYEVKIPSIRSAAGIHIGYAQLGSGRKYNSKEALTALDYRVGMFIYGFSYKFIYAPDGAEYLSFVFDNDFSFANLSAQIHDAGSPSGIERKERMDGLFFYTFRLGLNFGMPAHNAFISGIRPWVGVSTLNLTKFMNKGLAPTAERISSQEAPFTFGLSLMLF